MNREQVDEALLRPIEIIFSCQVCQKPISEAYQDAGDDKGFRDAAHSYERQSITKLWLTECAHVVCGEHLEGGGAPFHRAGERPRATCPICSSEKNDLTERTLYKVQGCSKGLYDDQIPSSWFETPPIKLDGTAKGGLDALRFHYLALCSFGTKLHKRYNSTKAELQIALNEKQSECAARQQLEIEVAQSRTRIKYLEHCETELRPWKERSSKIQYYLGLFCEITEENKRLRQQLTAMGYAVPSQTQQYQYPNGTEHEAQPDDISRNHVPALVQEESYVSSGRNIMTPRLVREPVSHIQSRTDSSRTLSGLPDLVSNPGTTEVETRPRLREGDLPPKNLKRTYLEEHRVIPERLLKSPRQERGESRQLMPPPALPSRPRQRSRRDSAVDLMVDYQDPRQDAQADFTRSRIKAGADLLQSENSAASMPRQGDTQGPANSIFTFMPHLPPTNIPASSTQSNHRPSDQDFDKFEVQKHDSRSRVLSNDPNLNIAMSGALNAGRMRDSVQTHGSHPPNYINDIEYDPRLRGAPDPSRSCQSENYALYQEQLSPYRRQESFVDAYGNNISHLGQSNSPLRRDAYTGNSPARIMPTQGPPLPYFQAPQDHYTHTRPSPNKAYQTHNPQRPLYTSQRQLSTPSPKRQPQQVTASVSSPFFQPSTSQSTRLTLTDRSRARPEHSSIPSRPIPTPPRPSRQQILKSRASTFSQPHPSPIPHTPRNALGLFERPDTMSVPRSPFFAAPQSRHDGVYAAQSATTDPRAYPQEYTSPRFEPQRYGLPVGSTACAGSGVRRVSQEARMGRHLGDYLSATDGYADGKTRMGRGRTVRR